MAKNDRVKRWLGYLICLGVSLWGAVTGLGEESKPPNFLILLADDVSARSLGCYGSPNRGTTPHIDRLAKESVVFDQMFVSEAICAPARAELYTGLFPVRNGCSRNHAATRRGTKSVAHYLKDLGYRVGLSGKRHFKPASVYPFERVAGFPLQCNQHRLPVEDWAKVRQFMQRSSEQPFCLFLCSVHAHAPWDSGDDTRWKLDEIRLPPHLVDTAETRRFYRSYLAEVRLFDAQVGRAVKVLDELGLAENTVLIVLDENGAGMPGGKWSSYDWGVRSACLVRWPAMVEGGRRTSVLAQYCDLLPTMIDAAGGEVQVGLDGRSLLPVLKGQRESHREAAFFVHNHAPVGPAYPIRAVVQGDYKLVWNLNHEGLFASRTINGFDFGYQDPVKDRHVRQMYQSWQRAAAKDSHAALMLKRFRQRPQFELYHLSKDPWEMENLASNPEHAPRIQALQGLIKDWMKQQGDTGYQADDGERH